MNKLLLSVLALGVVACQSKPAVQQQKTVATVPTAADWGNPADSLPPELSVRHGKVTRRNIISTPVAEPARIQQFFRQYKLSSILQTGAGSKQEYALIGFRGNDKYRTEAVILQARQDSQNPAVYLLSGLSRTKRKITPFEGQVTFESLSHEPLLTTNDERNIRNLSMFIPPIISGDKLVARYAVGGRVLLRENGKQSTNKVFTGNVIIELALTEVGRIRLDNPFLHGPSQGGGLKYEGVWTQNQSSAAEPTVWVDNIIGYSSNIFEDLAIGEREVNFNPKYAKLGWNDYWENDEWWTDSPRPRLNL